MPSPNPAVSPVPFHGRTASPGAASVARHLSLVVHDLRGPATALNAFFRLFEEQARPSLDPSAATWLDACQANAELTAHLCEALSILEGSCMRSVAPLEEAFQGAGRRLQKLLARGGVGLKVPGVFPDRVFERRRLGFAFEAVLVCVAHASGTGTVPLDVEALEREEHVVVTLESKGRAGEGLESLCERLVDQTPSGLSEMALECALEALRARPVTCRAGTISLRIPFDAEGAR